MVIASFTVIPTIALFAAVQWTAYSPTYRSCLSTILSVSDYKLFNRASTVSFLSSYSPISKLVELSTITIAVFSRSYPLRSTST